MSTPETARPLFWLGVLLILVWAGVACLLTGCASAPRTVPHVNVQPAIERVDRASELATDARGEVKLAVDELAKPDPDAEFVKVRLKHADALLVKQQEALRIAKLDLAEAHKAAALSAERAEELRQEAERYKVRYESMKKYRWAIAIICGWLLIKLLGNLGAWSPHGRVARFFVG